MSSLLFTTTSPNLKSVGKDKPNRRLTSKWLVIWHEWLFWQVSVCYWDGFFLPLFRYKVSKPSKTFFWFLLLVFSDSEKMDTDPKIYTPIGKKCKNKMLKSDAATAVKINFFFFFVPEIFFSVKFIIICEINYPRQISLNDSNNQHRSWYETMFRKNKGPSDSRNLHR